MSRLNQAGRANHQRILRASEVGVAYETLAHAAGVARRVTRNPAVAGMADRTAPVVKLTRQKIVIPSGIGLAAVHSWQLDTCASVYKL